MALSGDRAKLYDEEAKRKSGIAASADVAAAWAAARDAAAPAAAAAGGGGGGGGSGAWLVMRLDAAGKALELVASGASGGLAALRAHLADDAVSWACVGFAPGYPYGEGARKFASLTCVGGAVGAMKRGKVALQKSGVFGALEGLSADAGVFQGAAEATDEAILAELKRGMPNAQLLA